MLKLSRLGAWIEERLNNTLIEYINNNTNTILDTDRVIYAFKVYTDQGKHKGFENISINKRIRFIECQLSQSDSTVEATDYVSVTRDTLLEIIIPLDNIDEVGFEDAITEEIRTVIDNSFNKIGNTTLDNGERFAFKYSLSNTGIRANRPYIGDSISMTAYINFFSVEGGINSGDIEIYIDGEKITPMRYGFNRGTTQQSNVYSNDNTMTAKNTATSSLFSLNFDTTMRYSVPLMNALEWKMKGTNTGSLQSTGIFAGTNLPNVVHLVEIKLFITIAGQNGEIIREPVSEGTTTKYMIFENVSLSGAVPLLTSLSVSMTEAKVVLGLTPLSVYAYEHFIS